MMDPKRWGLVAAIALLSGSSLVYCGLSHKQPAAQVLPDGGYKLVIPGQSRFFIANPSNATYTVPSGAYVTSFSCVPTVDAGGAGGVQITPVSPGTTVPEAGPVISLPAGYEWGLDSVLQIPPQAFSAGTIFALTGSTCTITLYQAY